MLRKYQDEVAAAETHRRQAQRQLENASQQWHVQKRRFFTNPVNLLLPFTIGALLASRGSVAKQAVNWSRVISTSAKVVMTTYPLLARLTRKDSTLDSGRNDG